jgi:hypothetical protein
MRARFRAASEPPPSRLRAASPSPGSYRLKYGLRTVSAEADGLHINGVPAYLHGFGKHEDAELRGRGLDLPTLVKDMGLMEWAGANSVRKPLHDLLGPPPSLHDLRSLSMAFGPSP